MKQGKMNIGRTLGLLMLAGLVFACEGQKPGARCDEFFTNTCKAPLSCVSMEDKKVCAGSCDTGDMGKKICKDPALKPIEVSYQRGTTNLGGAGCYCLPK